MGDQRVIQPAMFLADMCAFEKLKADYPDVLPKVEGMAGFSVGEYAAACAAGVFTFEDGLRIVKLRGEAMQRCTADGEQGCIMSVMGLPEENVEKNVRLANEAGKKCFIANNNFPDMYIIAGTLAACNFLEVSTKRNAGATKNTIRSQIIGFEGAFHSPLMGGAYEALAAVLEEAYPRMSPPTCRLWSSIDASPVEPGTDPWVVVEKLKAHLVNRVYWMQTCQNMIKGGVEGFFEVGPQKQLKTMLKRIDEDVGKQCVSMAV